MSTFSQGHTRDYTRKRNMMQNNWDSLSRSRRTRLNEGDGILPKSKKYRDWHCKKGCEKKHEHKTTPKILESIKKGFWGLIKDNRVKEAA